MYQQVRQEKTVGCRRELELSREPAGRKSTDTHREGKSTSGVPGVPIAERFVWLVWRQQRKRCNRRESIEVGGRQRTAERTRAEKLNNKIKMYPRREMATVAPPTPEEGTKKKTGAESQWVGCGRVDVGVWMDG